MPWSIGFDKGEQVTVFVALLKVFPAGGTQFFTVVVELQIGVPADIDFLGVPVVVTNRLDQILTVPGRLRLITFGARIKVSLTEIPSGMFGLVSLPIVECFTQIRINDGFEIGITHRIKPVSSLDKTEFFLLAD